MTKFKKHFRILLSKMEKEMWHLKIGNTFLNPSRWDLAALHLNEASSFLTSGSSQFIILAKINLDAVLVSQVKFAAARFLRHGL